MFSEKAKHLLKKHSNFFTHKRIIPNRNSLEKLLKQDENPISEPILTFLLTYWNLEFNFPNKNNVLVDISFNYKNANDSEFAAEVNKRHAEKCRERLAIVGIGFWSTLIILVSESGKIYGDKYGDLHFLGNSAEDFLESTIDANT